MPAFGFLLEEKTPAIIPMVEFFPFQSGDEAMQKVRDNRGRYLAVVAYS
jgi:hypothetical protein